MANKAGSGGSTDSPTPALRRITAADDVLALNDRIYEDVEVPEWNAIVTVRSMTGQERDRLEASMIETRGRSRQMNLRNMRARTVAACVVDGNPNNPETPGITPHLLFTRDQVDVLGQKNARAIQRLFNKGQQLSGISDSDVEELTIDLGNDQSGESGSS